MKKKSIYRMILAKMMVLLLTTVAHGTNDFITICYHDIPLSIQNDPHAVDLRSFIDQIEYMRTHGYNFISIDDVKAADKNNKQLPTKAVLMSFDDGYTSFSSNVVPILKLYNCPALLAICSLWVDEKPPADITAQVMSWDQIKEVSEQPLVTIASHSHNLHRAIQYNPQGNTAQAATSRIYFPKEKKYETELEYTKRISKDMKLARNILTEKTGTPPDVLVWPYGEYNQLTLKQAKANGFNMTFGLSDVRTETDNIMELDRWLIVDNPSINDFISDLKMHTEPYEKEIYSSRIVQVDLDLIYDANPEQQERNLGKFLDRMIIMRPSTVYLQAFADPDGDGNVDAVYFPNSILPMRGDLLNRVANQLYIRSFKVFIWMPTLAITLPNHKTLQNDMVMEYKNGTIRPSSSWYKRLSPFSSKAETIVSKLYEEMAAHVRFHGVLFQDDAYLTDTEDFNANAIKIYEKELGIGVFDPRNLSPTLREKWIRIKTNRLNNFTKSLMTSVRKYRPSAKFARNMYPIILTEPQSEEWFAQNYEDFLRIYDNVVLMAYPEHEQVIFKMSWLKKLVKKVQEHSDGIDKTVFKIQAYDWKKGKWLPTKDIINKTKKLIATGAKHIAYYPDDYTIDKPVVKDLRMEMSTKSSLFKEPPRRKY